MLMMLMMMKRVVIAWLLITITLALGDYNSEDIDELDIINEFVDSNIDIPPECNQGHYFINKPDDFKKISHCQIIHGNMTIANYIYPIVSFGKIETITGTLMITKSPDIVRIEGNSLTNIGKKFLLRELTSLSVIVFPNLSSIKVIDWRVLPILSSVQLNDEVDGLESVIISDTSLTGFSGFTSSKFEIFDINNNRFLNSIDSNVETIGESLHISANAFGSIVSLPKLKTANNMTIQDVGTLNMGSLETVSNSVSLINNQIESIKFPNLNKVGGTLNIFKNKKLSSMNFNNISEIGGGLIISNNTMIEKINFLPKLNTIGGALELSGNIKEIDLKNLKLIRGSAKVKTESPSFDCTQFLKSDLMLVIRGGKIECLNANNEKYITNSPGSNDSDTGITYDSNGRFIQSPSIDTRINVSGTRPTLLSSVIPLVMIMLIFNYVVQYM